MTASAGGCLFDVAEACLLACDPQEKVRLTERAAADWDADRLGIILRDEVSHVAAGSRWFRYLCAERGLEPEETYFGLVRAYLGDEIRRPLNLEDRRRAGFGEGELVWLQQLCARR